MEEKMKRRKFLKVSAVGAASLVVAGVTGKFAINEYVKLIPQDTKRVFWEFGICSHTLFYIMNREFGHLKGMEERASDPLAGGLLNTGHQCGMLWGATLAAGAESFRRTHDPGQAAALAMAASQRLVESFVATAGTVNCRDIVGCDFTSKLGTAKVLGKALLSGIVNSTCFNLAEKWAPEAIESAKQALAETPAPTQQPMSCASEVARRMGAGDEEATMVAGFAGGLGLSGNACGALAAAIWINTLAWCRKNYWKSGYANPNAQKIVDGFYRETHSEMLCQKICGRRFKTVDEHTAFVKGGGCSKLITALARPEITK
jgi:hypothetical protein